MLYDGGSYIKNQLLFYEKMKNKQKYEKNLQKVLTLQYFCDKIENVKVNFTKNENKFQNVP